MFGVDELASLPVGERLQVLRERQGKTRAVVAGLVGRSEEWLKAVERGRLNTPRLPMLARLAEVLGVADLAVITGDVGARLTVAARDGHESVPGLRAAIESHVLVSSEASSTEPADLIRRASDAWFLWHASPAPRAAVGAILPRLITEARTATRRLDGLPRRQAYTALTSSYALAGQLLAWVADSALLSLTADRCMTAAEQSDDPDSLALAAWVVGNVWRSTGREPDALALATDAAALMAPRLNDEEGTSRALWGAVRLHAAITAAKMGREGDALRNLDDASSMAERLPADFAHSATLFGRANAGLTGISVHVELRKGRAAVAAADTHDPDAVPSRDRRARVWLETARGYAQRKDTTAALHVLQRATSISKESMRTHPLARTLAGELVTTGGRIIQLEARSLASDLGLLV